MRYDHIHHDIFESLFIDPVPAEEALYSDISVNAQVVRRAKMLGMSKVQLKEVWQQLKEDFINRKLEIEVSKKHTEIIIDESSTAEDLAKHLASKNAHIIFKDSAAKLLNGLTKGLIISGENILLSFRECAAIDTKLKNEFVFLITGSKIQINDLNCVGCDGLVGVENANGIKLHNFNVSGSKHAAIFVCHGSRNVEVCYSNFQGNFASCVFVGDDAENVFIHNNVVSNNKGNSNWMAGIVISDRTEMKAVPKLTGLFEKDGYWARGMPILDMPGTVGKCWINDNTICDNKSSGLYLDGAINCWVENNFISGNSKEGVCLDYGTSGTIMLNNTIERNGDRFGKTDKDLAKDFVAQFGRDDRGNAKAKVPGVSIDNAAYNILAYNKVQNNFGSGIKFVRSSYHNEINANTVINNNLGEFEEFHFFGIEMGAAMPDVAAKDIDFLPTCANLIYRNLVIGHHFAGIFMDHFCRENQIFDNVIIRCKHWSIESLDEGELNPSWNNVYTQLTRNATNKTQLIDQQ